VIFEWNTGPGPTVVYYPAGNRNFAKVWKLPVTATRYSEVYADWLDKKLSPRLVEQARGHGLTAVVRCVDQQPIQVMRMRRREIEHASIAVAAH
jgi:PIN domain nuclease of toxin-antitoxin system